MNLPDDNPPRRRSRYGKFLKRLLELAPEDFIVQATQLIAPSESWYREQRLKRDHLQLKGQRLYESIQASRVLANEQIIQPTIQALVQSGITVMQVVLPSGLGHDNKYTIVRCEARQLVQAMENSAILHAAMFPLQRCEQVGPWYTFEEMEATIASYLQHGVPFWLEKDEYGDV